MDQIASGQPADAAASEGKRSGSRAYAVYVLTSWQHFSAWNDMTPLSWKHDVTSKVRLRQLMRCIYLKNNSAKFGPDPIWNNGALRFLKRVALKINE